jgi:hypothetical protein
MPRWDDPRGPSREDDRWRRERWEREAQGRRDWRGGERRAFDERQSYGGPERGREPWRDERYSARYDQDRTGYARYEDAGDRAERRFGVREDNARYGDASPMRGGEPYGYAGQEYGLEGHPGVGSGRANAGSAGGGAGWDFERDEARRRDFDRRDPGVGQSQAGYGAQAQPHPDHEFDPDYVQWREEQLRSHDRDYQEWRRSQHRQYDDQYRQYRDERQRHFGEAFHQWRSQRGMVGGVPDTGIGSVGQGQGGYGDKTGIPGGYNAASAVDRPTGYLDPPGHLSSDPAMQQVGGGRGARTYNPTGDRTPEFGREPPQVQSAADGDTQGHEHHHRADDTDRDKNAAERDATKRH